MLSRLFGLHQRGFLALVQGQQIEVDDHGSTGIGCWSFVNDLFVARIGGFSFGRFIAGGQRFSGRSNIKLVAALLDGGEFALWNSHARDGRLGEGGAGKTKGNSECKSGNNRFDVHFLSFLKNLYERALAPSRNVRT